jgi:hypothetical protein
MRLKIEMLIKINRWSIFQQNINKNYRKEKLYLLTNKN